MSSFGVSRRDVPRYSPELKQTMKEIFILYLWDMFQEEDTTITQNTVYIRNAVWQYRDLFFRNRAVFHWMIEMLFNDPWSVQLDNIIIRKKRLRDFFDRVIQGLILNLSSQDLAWNNWQYFPDYQMSSSVISILTRSVSIYHQLSDRSHDHYRTMNEEQCVGICQAKWTEIRPHSRQNTAAFMPRQLPKDIRAQIRRLADHTDTHWIPPESREQVVKYIEDTYAFNEI
jgi:hypothetical protein